MADDPLSQALELPRALLRWWAALLREAAHAPETVLQARHLLQGLVELPAQLERVVGSVESVTSPLSGSLDDVAEGLAEIRDRLQHLDTVILHLRDTLVAVVAAVPGGRRALDRVPAPPGR